MRCWRPAHLVTRILYLLKNTNYMNHLHEPQALPAKKKMGGCQKLAIGCFILVILMCLSCGLGTWWITANIRTVGTNMTRAMLKLAIKEIKLPENQQTRIFDRIDKVARQFEEEKISFVELERIFLTLAQSPLFPAGTALVAERVYLDKSGLEDPEKAAGKLSIRRFTRGSLDESISPKRCSEVLDIISTWNAESRNREFLENLTDTQLRQFIAEAKRAADDAGIAETIAEINFADEFDRAVETALNKGPAKP